MSTYPPVRPPLPEHETFNPNPVTMHGDESWQNPGEECKPYCRRCLADEVETLRGNIEAIKQVNWRRYRESVDTPQHGTRS